MIRFSNKAFEPLDPEEAGLMLSIERGEWQPVKNLIQEKEKAVQVAQNTWKKDQPLNISFSQKDSHQIQIRAIKEGISSQILIFNVIQQYLKGALVPKQ